MAFDLRSFALADMLRCGLDLRAACKGATSVEQAAGKVVRYLRAQCLDDAGAPACALVRYYQTTTFSTLPDELRAFTGDVLSTPQPAAMKCLTLIATAGDEPAWNDRRASRGHQVIPLAAPEMIARAPMIAGLLAQLGLDPGDVVAPTPEFLRHAAGRTYNVFHVEDAVGSPFIPAQDDFVRPRGVRSVLGFGGVVRDELFAVILFSRVAVPRASADRFRNLALDLKSALFALQSVPVFEEPS